MIMLAAAFLLLSGIASLSYQVVWVRLLGLSMGSTSAAISTVLAAFFMGLALGSYLAERITRNRIDSLKIYIALEIVIGVSGLVLLPVLLNLDSIMANFPGMGSSISFKFAMAMALLAIPTICMGATFPVMAAILIRKRHEVGVRVGQLYSLNTAGAVLGAALAGFVFVPNWGLDGAIYIAFSINMLIVILGIYLNNKISLPPIEQIPGAATSSAASLIEEAPLRGRALLVLFATGLVSIATEVGWTKYLSIFTGTTIYGFSAILTIFLIGIASGSWVIKSHIERMRRPELWMAAGLVLLGVMLLFTRAGLSIVPAINEAVNHLPTSPWVKHGTRYFFVFLILFPPTFVLGMLFPLNLRLYCGNLQGVRARIGKAYAVNTVAAIFGSVMAGFWIIPEYGTDVLLTSMAFVILILPLFFVPALIGPVAKRAIVIGLLLAVASNWLFPHISYKDMVKSVAMGYDDEAASGKKPKFLYLKEGKVGVIAMVTYNDQHVKLLANGLNESFIDLNNDQNVLLAESLLAYVPYMLHDDPKSAFVVGFGGGITSRALTTTKDLESIKVVELEPAVVDAGRAIVGGEILALQDPRLTLEFNDARNTLLLEDTRYDIIVSQPSHPWLARASNVFTKEFFGVVKSRLNTGGIYGQWVNLFNMDATTLRSIFKAFYGVFPHGVSFANLESGDLLLFGSSKEIIFKEDQITQRLNEPKIKAALKYHEITKVDDLFWFFALSRDEALKAAGDVAANSDTNILSEVRLSALIGDPEGEENPYKFLRTHYKLSVADYLEGDPAEKLSRIADYFYFWNKDDLAALIATQLKMHDPVKARGVEYEALYRAAKMEDALEMYATQQPLPDRSHYQHALMLAAMGKYEEAYQAAEKIEKLSSRASITAKLMYLQKNKSLSTIKTQYPGQRKWQLTLLADTNLTSAGKELAAMFEDQNKGQGKHQSKDKLVMEIEQLRVLVRYFAKLNDKLRLDQFTQRYVEMLNKQVERLEKQLDSAFNDGSKLRGTTLIDMLKALKPDAKSLEKYTRKLEAMVSQTAPQIEG